MREHGAHWRPPRDRAEQEGDVISRITKLVPWLMLVLLTCFAPSARAQDAGEPGGFVVRNGQMVRELLAGRTNRLSTSAGSDPDTVYIGKSYTNHTAPDNYWNFS